MYEKLKQCFIILLLVIATSTISPAETKTAFRGAGKYGELADNLYRLIVENPLHQKKVLGGKERVVFVFWARDHIHVTKALKYYEPDISSLVEYFLEEQTPEGLFYDYYMPIEWHQNYRMNLFDHRYWKIYPQERLQMHRLPVTADVEYLMVEGVHYIWQATGDTEFVRKWIPSLERGMYYAMSDPVRWSKRFQLVKRGYTLDTWDFQQLPARRDQLDELGIDLQEAIFNVNEETPMGIMHGDNSGMYAACRQLAQMHRAIGNTIDGEVWDKQAEIFRLRTNKACWNGRFYKHFAIDDPPPAYNTMDQENTLGLSNTYDINRGLPTEEMAESIIATYRRLHDETADESFAEWYGIYPPVRPHFAGYDPGRYVNGGVIILVAGELAKAAFQHGYEDYGVDILNRIIDLMAKQGGKLPCAYKPDGTVDKGIPDNWGQAAVLSAMIEGLAGVTDRGALFEQVELSPRWLAAGVDEVEVSVGYGPTGKGITYTYSRNPERRAIELRLTGAARKYDVRVMLPAGDAAVKSEIDGSPVKAAVETVRNTRYAVLRGIDGGERTVRVTY